MELPRWNRREWLQILTAWVEQHGADLSCAPALGTWYDDWFLKLPAWPYSGLCEEPADDAFRERTWAIEHVPLQQLRGAVWLFEPPIRWPHTPEHWTRVAQLTLSAVRVTASGAVWNPTVTDSWLPLDGYPLTDGTWWIDDGCRRVYVCWLLGNSTIPIVG